VERRCFTPLEGEGGITASAEPLATLGESGADQVGWMDACGGKPVRVYFGFNEHVLGEEARAGLAAAAECLKLKPELAVVVQGHCDERGSTEYNLALGERRAQAVARYVADLGVAEGRVTAVSLGEERPLDPGHDEVAWAKNRRAELVVRRRP
jgi:peptidoglycan-associated lipoprotein